MDAAFEHLPMLLASLAAVFVFLVVIALVAESHRKRRNAHNKAQMPVKQGGGTK